MKYILAILLACFNVIVSVGSYGQDLFDTKSAEIVLKVRHHGHVSEVWSKRLNILLDLSDASFNSYLEKQSIETRDELLIDDLKALPERIDLYGKFGVTEIQTTTHLPMEFDLKGKLAVGSNLIPVSGMAKLQHIDGGDIACLLSFEFVLPKDALPADFVERHSVDEIEIKVLQSILNPRSN